MKELKVIRKLLERQQIKYSYYDGKLDIEDNQYDFITIDISESTNHNEFVLFFEKNKVIDWMID